MNTVLVTVAVCLYFQAVLGSCQLASDAQSESSDYSNNDDSSLLSYFDSLAQHSVNSANGDVSSASYYDSSNAPDDASSDFSSDWSSSNTK
jgi:hypothetical protein